MPVEISVATSDRELERWLAVRNAVDLRPLTLASYRAERTSIVGGLTLLVSEDGRDAGAGSVSWSSIGLDSRSASVGAWVLPAHRKHGVGTRLVDRLFEIAIEQGMERTSTIIEEGDAASMRFAERRGLVADGGGQIGHLDLTDLPALEDLDPIDIAVTSFAERPDLGRAVFELVLLVQREIPALAHDPAPTFEAFRADTTNDTGFLSDLSLIALGHDRVVGALLVFDSADATAFIGLTAVHPDTRRRGVARTLKLELARRARNDGWRRIETYNDGSNHRIRALNEDLGYIYAPPVVIMKGPLRRPGSSA